MHFILLSLAALVAAQGYDPICASDQAFAACCDPNQAINERDCKIYDPSQITPGDEPRLEYFRGVCEESSPEGTVRTPRCCRLDGFNAAIQGFDLACNLSEDEVADEEVCPDNLPDPLCCPSTVPESKITIVTGTTCEAAAPTPTASAVFTESCDAEDESVPRCCSSRTTTYNPSETATITTCNVLPPVAPTEPIVPTETSEPTEPTETPSPTATPTPEPVCDGPRKPRCCNPNKLILLNTDCKALNPGPTDLVSFTETCQADSKSAKCCALELFGLGLVCVNPT